MCRGLLLSGGAIVYTCAHGTYNQDEAKYYDSSGGLAGLDAAGQGGTAVSVRHSGSVGAVLS